MNDEDLREVTAGHEAGHVVMRWLLGLPATDVYVNNGYGLCEGTGEQCRAEDVLLVLLAGLAVESAYGMNGIDIEHSDTTDLRQARELLTHDPYLRLSIPERIQPGQEVQPVFDTVEVCLAKWFRRCCDDLRQHLFLVDDVADAVYDGYLSAADLQTILDQYEQGLENNG
jgi:hypothetical protein